MLYVSFAVSGVVTVSVDTDNPAKAKYLAAKEFDSIVNSTLSPEIYGVTREILRVEDESSNIITDY